MLFNCEFEAIFHPHTLSLSDVQSGPFVYI